MIGHSLGSHLSGYAGYTLQKDFNLKLGRITGLDPAEPFFKDSDPLVRLDISDAKFVDVIHSDAKPFMRGGLGMQKAIGHVDFYPNGGYDNPGCSQGMSTYIEQERGSFFWGVQQFVSCNHLRSHQFFTESIMPKCPFVAITCDSYEVSFIIRIIDIFAIDKFKKIKIGISTLKKTKILYHHINLTRQIPYKPNL